MGRSERYTVQGLVLHQPCFRLMLTTCCLLTAAGTHYPTTLHPPNRVAFLGSTTSSVIAEASAPDHDTYSLDGISVAESEAERQGFEW